MHHPHVRLRRLLWLSTPSIAVLKLKTAISLVWRSLHKTPRSLKACRPERVSGFIRNACVDVEKNPQTARIEPRQRSVFCLQMSVVRFCVSTRRRCELIRLQVTCHVDTVVEYPSVCDVCLATSVNATWRVVTRIKYSSYCESPSHVRQQNRERERERNDKLQQQLMSGFEINRERMSMTRWRPHDVGHQSSVVVTLCELKYWPVCWRLIWGDYNVVFRSVMRHCWYHVYWQCEQ